MSFIQKFLYKMKRVGNSIFTYNCASCGEEVRAVCLCENCRKKLVPAEKHDLFPVFAYYYTGPAKDTILCYKFQEDDYEYCFDTLFDWLVTAYNKIEDKNFDAVVCVPAYKEKYTRLYELVRNFSFMNDLNFEPKLLTKIRKTEKQHKISSEERRTNLIGAFEASSSVAGKHILLIDDIYTTGSTVNECSKALLKAGAEKVTVLTILKTYYKE